MQNPAEVIDLKKSDLKSPSADASSCYMLAPSFTAAS